MESQLIYFILIVLIIVTALNLKLTLGLLKIINSPPVDVNSQLPVNIGEKLPVVLARSLNKKGNEKIYDDGIPTVLVFLSSKCPVCREKIPEIESIYTKSGDAGVALHLITKESKSRIRNFFSDSKLLAAILFISNTGYKALNPTQASPYYLFIDHEQRLQACGTIGDENWQSFVEQMNNVGLVEARA